MNEPLILKKYEKIFYPKTIAIIGASENKEKIGGYILNNLIKLKNIKVYPVNPKYEKIQNITNYKTIKDIKKDIDLAIIIIKAQYVLQSFYELIEKKVKNVIIISAGFKEIGKIGEEREKILKELVLENEINLIGPNCLGILNTSINLNCSFAKDIPSSGSVALISQSGAVIDAIIDWSFKYKIGFSKIISLGNMVGFDELDALKYLSCDKQTKTIVFYMETLKKGEEFGKLLKEVSKTKQVIIIKPGFSDIAKKAIGSHTGSLAQNNILIQALIEENNGIYIENLLDLFNQILITKTNIPKNENTIILTNAGGPGVITTDALAKTNLKLYSLTQEEKEEFKFLPNEASLNNPIDILGDAKSDRYIKTLKVLDKNKNISNILILLTPQIMTDSLTIADEISKFSKISKKTIITSFIGQKEILIALEILDRNIANFQTPTEAIMALDKLYNYSIKIKQKDEKLNIPFICNKINLENKKGLLDYKTTYEIFKSIKLKLPEKQNFKTINEALNFQLIKNKKYVLKIDSARIIHKKDIGAVIIDIDYENYENNIKKIFDIAKLHANDFTITLEEQTKGIEIIIGLKYDEELGSFVMFGAGGTNVSIFKDINFSQAPLSYQSSLNLIKKSKIYPLLEGYRGQEGVNIENLVRTLEKISYLQKIYPEIKEMDINPIIINKNEINFVDVKLII